MKRQTNSGVLGNSITGLYRRKDELSRPQVRVAYGANYGVPLYSFVAFSTHSPRGHTAFVSPPHTRSLTVPGVAAAVMRSVTHCRVTVPWPPRILAPHGKSLVWTLPLS